MQKRQTLSYSISSDTVFTSPQIDDFVCDAKNGPNPLAFKILEVHGAKTAVVYFRIETWIGGNPANGDPRNDNLVLANRWSARTQDAGDWKCNIVTSGRMRLRADVLNSVFPNNPTPDIFRQAVLPLPVPDGFYRRMPDVTVTADGLELVWSVVDEQRVLNLGPSSNGGAITRLKGQYTNGSYVDVKDMKSVLGKAWHAIVGGTVGALAGPVGAVTGAIVGYTWNFVPTIQNSFQFRAYGAPGANRLTMLRQLLNLALDRFGPQNVNFFGVKGGPVLVSLYATSSADVDELWVESAASSSAPGKRAQSRRLRDALQPEQRRGGQSKYQGGRSVDRQRPRANPNPPGPGTAKGTWVGTLLMQALQGVYAVPPVNAPSETSQDLGQNFR